MTSTSASHRWLSGLSAGLRGLVFYSASADGTVLQWILGQSSMSCQVQYSHDYAHAPDSGESIFIESQALHLGCILLLSKHAV